MAKKATTLHDNLGNDLLPVTNASITFMDDGNSVQAEIEDLKLKTQYNKGHYTTKQELLNVYPNGIQNAQSRKGWYAIIGSTDTMWIWDIEGNKWVDSGKKGTGAVDSVNGLDGEVILTGGNINATATINDTSTTKLINAHLTDIYNNTVDLSSSQTITGTKVFTEVIGLANTSEGTVDQIKHINSNFLITSGTGQNLLNIDEGLETISAFNRELAYEDEIQQIQGDYATKSELSQEIQNVTDMIPTKVSELTNDRNYATEQYVQQNGGKIDTISVNGVQQTISNKNVNISVPTDYVPETRTINNKPLSSNITLNASDVGALSSSTSYVTSVNGSSGAIKNVAKMAHIGMSDNNLLLVGINPNNPMTTNDILHANGILIKDLALKSEIPVIPDTSNLVTTDTEQTISGAKTFSATTTKVNARIEFTNTSNPYIKMSTDSKNFYLQSSGGLLGLGTDWGNATKWDSSGNVTFNNSVKIKNWKMTQDSSGNLVFTYE